LSGRCNPDGVRGIRTQTQLLARTVLTRGLVLTIHLL
jgi:hypothetical protein